VDFRPDEDTESIRDAVGKVCAAFDDSYWRERDERHEFPWDFYRALADGSRRSPLPARR
jgi:acyl-CoA dehydrogenase